VLAKATALIQFPGWQLSPWEPSQRSSCFACHHLGRPGREAGASHAASPRKSGKRIAVGRSTRWERNDTWGGRSPRRHEPYSTWTHLAFRKACRPYVDEVVLQLLSTVLPSPFSRSAAVNWENFRFGKEKSFLPRAGSAGARVGMIPDQPDTVRSPKCQKGWEHFAKDLPPLSPGQ